MSYKTDPPKLDIMIEIWFEIFQNHKKNLKKYSIKFWKLKNRFNETYNHQVIEGWPTKMNYSEVVEGPEGL